jgi:hypothetical protein
MNINLDKPNIKKGFKPIKAESFPINTDGNDYIMYLYSAGDNGNRYTRVEFNDYSTYLVMIMDREALKGMADFINNYLEKNNDQ